MNRIAHYLRMCYRLTLNADKQEEALWKELKKFHLLQDYPSGIYEKEKVISTTLKLSDSYSEAFNYSIIYGHYYCSVRLIRHYPEELSPEIFILTTHLNNILMEGGVSVDTEEQNVEYITRKDILITLLYPGFIYERMNRHYKVARRLHQAFTRLINENEAPALIVADFLKNLENVNGEPE
ncbi:MAG: hypothetical protein M9901_15180 [Lentimicrobium sp.]|nr:hypothetical protein [Lentimicrobium sp.]